MAVPSDVSRAGADDPVEAEVAELLADVRALLQHARGRGMTAEDPAAPVSVAVEEPQVVATPRAGTRPAPTERQGVTEAAAAGNVAWAALASEARTRAEGIAESGADGLRRVRDDLGDCRRCALSAGRKTIVFGVGDPDADLVVVGEAPGYNEDVQGEPFVGDAGQMLDKMLEKVLGLSRSQVYIANVVKCRPPSNRNPLPPEIDACLPFLRRQIVAIRPKLLLVLGSVAYKSLFGAERGITSVRGVWHELDGVPALPTFHPAYLLRQPDDKRLVFEDLKVLRARYDALGGRRS